MSEPERDATNSLNAASSAIGAMIASTPASPIMTLANAETDVTRKQLSIAAFGRCRYALPEPRAGKRSDAHSHASTG